MHGARYIVEQNELFVPSVKNTKKCKKKRKKMLPTNGKTICRELPRFEYGVSGRSANVRGGIRFCNIHPNGTVLQVSRSA